METAVSEGPVHEVERIVLTDANGYREVSLAYRIARAAMLDARGSGPRTGRIACPGLDASRSTFAYGRQALPGTDARNLKVWSDALGVNSLGIKAVAYLSGPWWTAPLALLFGRFDDRALNTGFLRSLKRRTNTGILTTEAFDQDALNRFVWDVRPDLSGTPMTRDWLYSDRSARQYVDLSRLPAVRAHNARNADPKAGWLARKLGLFLSTFEMSSLLLGTLAQPVPRPDAPTQGGSIPGGSIADASPPDTVSALHVRDLHDLYRYGFMPALAEERLRSAGLLAFPPVYARGAA